jgi:predicted DNA-binding transcriptional regulator YafY
MSVRPVARSVARPGVLAGGRGPSKPRGPRVGRPGGKFTQQRRLDRLRSALESNPNGLSIAEIASLIDVTARSVRRYLGYLKVATPIEPVSAGPGRENLWRIKPSERARAVPLRRAPAYCLFAGRGVFDPLKGSALFDALELVHREILQVANRPARGPAQQGEISGDTRLDERLAYVSHPATSYAGRGEEIDDLFRATAELHAVRFRYREGGSRAGQAARGPASGEAVAAHPYAVFLHRGAIIVVARDVHRAELRAFAFERMMDLAVQEGERFALPADFRAADCAHGVFGVSTEPARTRLLVEFDARVADEVRTRKLHPSQKIATSPDGRVRLSIVVPAPLVGEVARWILGFADAARVIEPPELVAEVAAALAAAAKRYG